MSTNLHAAIARAVRTFEAASVPLLVMALGFAKAGHLTIDETNKLALCLIAAVVAALSGFFLQLGSVVATTALGKALVQVAQTFGTGFGTLVVANLTIAGGIAVFHWTVALAAASIVSGLLVLVRANSEMRAVAAG